MGDRLRSTALIPFMRSKNINFVVDGLKPNTRVYPFFDKVAVTNFVTNAYLVNNGEMGGDVSDDESTSSSSGVSQTLADKFARGMRDAVRYIEQEMAARNRRQRTMFGLIRDIA